MMYVSHRNLLGIIWNFTSTRFRMKEDGKELRGNKVGNIEHDFDIRWWNLYLMVSPFYIII